MLAWYSRGFALHPLLCVLPFHQGPFGVGDLGPEAYAFVDWLHEAGMQARDCIAARVRASTQRARGAAFGGSRASPRNCRGG
jgi:hypothetical protein